MRDLYSSYAHSIEINHSPQRGRGKPTGSLEPSPPRLPRLPPLLPPINLDTVVPGEDVQSDSIRRQRVEELVRDWEGHFEDQNGEDDPDLPSLESMAQEIMILARGAYLNTLGGDSVQPTVRADSRLLFLHSCLLLKLLSDPQKRRKYLELQRRNGAKTRESALHEIPMALQWDQQVSHWLPIIEQLDKRANQPVAIVTKTIGRPDRDILSEHGVVDSTEFPVCDHQTIVDDLITILTVIRVLIKYSFADLGPSERARADVLEPSIRPLKQTFIRILSHNMLDMVVRKVPIVPQNIAMQLGVSPNVHADEGKMPFIGLLAPRNAGQPLTGSITAHASYLFNMFHTAWLPHWGYMSDTAAICPLPCSKLWYEVLKTLVAFVDAALECPGLSGWVVDRSMLGPIGPRVLSVFPNTSDYRHTTLDDFFEFSEAEIKGLLEEAIDIEKSATPQTTNITLSSDK